MRYMYSKSLPTRVCFVQPVSLTELTTSTPWLGHSASRKWGSSCIFVMLSYSGCFNLLQRLLLKQKKKKKKGGKPRMGFCSQWLGVHEMMKRFLPWQLHLVRKLALATFWLDARVLLRTNEAKSWASVPQSTCRSIREFNYQLLLTIHDVLGKAEIICGAVQHFMPSWALPQAWMWSRKMIQ